MWRRVCAYVTKFAVIAFLLKIKYNPLEIDFIARARRNELAKWNNRVRHHILHANQGIVELSGVCAYLPLLLSSTHPFWLAVDLSLYVYIILLASLIYHK